MTTQTPTTPLVIGDRVTFLHGYERIHTYPKWYSFGPPKGLRSFVIRRYFPVPRRRRSRYYEESARPFDQEPRHDCGR